MPNMSKNEGLNIFKTDENIFLFINYESPREESNPHIRLRSPEFCPLNYEGFYKTSSQIVI